MGEAVELSSESGDLRNTPLQKGTTAYLFKGLDGKTAGFNTEGLSLFVISKKLSGINELRKPERWKDAIALLFLGDHHEPQYLSKPIQVRANGLLGDEYTYSDSNGSHMFARGRVFEAGGNIYFLRYIAQTSQNVKSEEAGRFFESFQLTPQLKRTIPDQAEKRGDIEFSKTGAKPLLLLQKAKNPSISFDGSRILVYPELNRLVVYDVRSTKQIQSFSTDWTIYNHSIGPFSKGYISSDGTRVLAFADGGQLSIFDVNTGKMLNASGEKLSWSAQISNPSFDLRYIAYRAKADSQPGSDTKTFEIGVLDLRDGTNATYLGEIVDSHDQWGRPLVSSDGTAVASSRSNYVHKERNTTVVWDRVTGRELLRIPCFSINYNFSADGKRFVANCILTSPNEMFDRDPIAEVQKQKDSKLHRYVETTGDNRAEVWDLGTGLRISEIGAEFGNRRPEIKGVELSPNGDYLATAVNKYILVWNANSGQLIAAQQVNDYLHNAKFSDNGVFVISDGGDDVVNIWRFDEILKLAQIKRF
jgi:WD40 repeat protein